MTNLKDVLAPFRIAREIQNAVAAHNPPLVVIERHEFVTREHHPTGNEEFDTQFRIGTTLYNDGSNGSVSIRALSGRGTQGFYTCFLYRKELDQVIDTLIHARDLAFPPGGRSYIYSPGEDY